MWVKRDHCYAKGKVLAIISLLYKPKYVQTAEKQIKKNSPSSFSVKPSMPETTALGAAMAAGAAEGVSVWSLSPEDLSEVTSEKFEPQINPEGTVSCRLLSLHDLCVASSCCLKSKRCFCVCASQKVSFGTLDGRRRSRNPWTGRRRSLFVMETVGTLTFEPNSDPQNWVHVILL